MSGIQWNDTYETGIETIDRFNRRVVEIIDELQPAVNAPDADAITEKFVRELHDSFMRYQSDIIQLLKKIDYAYINEFHRSNKDFLHTIRELHREAEQNKKIVPTRMIGFLKHWFTKEAVKNSQQINKFVTYNKEKIAAAKFKSNAYKGFMKWEERFSTGNEQIDNDHKMLVEIINRLCSIEESSQRYQTIYKVVHELADYTQRHFKTEEDLMAKHNYDGYEEHRRKHKELIKELTQIIADLKDRRKCVLFDLIEMLKNWLIEHICEEDKKMCEAIFGKPQKAATT